MTDTEEDERPNLIRVRVIGRSTGRFIHALHGGHADDSATLTDPEAPIRTMVTKALTPRQLVGAVDSFRWKGV